MSNPPIEFTPRPISPRQRFLLGAGLFTALALALQFWRIYTLTATFDQGLFLQEIWSALGGRPFESTLASELSSPVLLDKTALPTLGYLHLGQHFTPLLLLWVPLVALLGPWSLPIVQIGLISAGGLVLYELARCDLDERIACWIALSYFASGTVIGPSLENFHDLCAVPVLVFSLEMPAESLIFRMLSSIGRLDQGKLRTGQLTDDDWPGFNNAVKKLKDRPLYIDDSAGVSPMEMRSRARRIKREHGALGMIVVDYLQLMQIKGSTEGRVNEISEISRSLKLLAREFECPVIALSQLNRGLEQRPNKRPVMSDLRESGAIEQDADVIAFIYRDEVYNEDTPDKGVAEVIIGKQRNGPIGTVRLSFLGQFTRFENFTQARYDDSYTHGM